MSKGLDYNGLVYFWGKLKDTFQEKLVSGTSIKTINNTSLLGSGDIEVAPSVTSTDIPTADTIAEFDSNAHMNSSDKTTQEIESFLTSLGIGSSKYVLSNVGMYGRGDIGDIKAFAGSVLPSGWLLCDGSAVSRTTYSDLFAVIGDTYGIGDGSTTFNLPDLRGRFPIGSDTTYSIGETGGASTVTLTTDEMPSHSHEFKYGGTAFTLNPDSSETTAGFTSAGTGGLWGGAGKRASANTMLNTGSGGAHNNMPPYLGLNYIIYAGNSNSSITNASIDIFYPVGSYYHTSDTTFDPNIQWGGTWIKVDEGKFLQATETAADVGNSVSAGLPNITGAWWGSYGESGVVGGSGALSNYSNGSYKDGFGTAWKTGMGISLDASRSSSIYGNSTTVQPPAILIYIWHRTA